MKSMRGFRLVQFALLALLAAYCDSGVAKAQVMAGKFTLPFEARWGVATLPPGDYTFSLDNPGTASRLVLFRGRKGVAQILNQSYDTTAPTGRSRLTVIRNSAGNTVRDLRLPELGMILHYAPHQAKPKGAAGEREIAEVLPVVLEGK